MNIKSNFYNTECNELGMDWMKTTNAVDRVRREKVTDIFPELYKIIANEYKI